MNFNGNFSQIEEVELQDINGGAKISSAIIKTAAGAIGGAIAAYDAASDFIEGYLKGATKPSK